MRVFLTGATGYLGSAVLSQLLGRGDDVVALVRSPDAATGVEAQGATPALGGLDDADWLRAQVTGLDAVIHAASPNDASSAAVDGAVLDAVLPALAGSPTVYVHTGGTWVHGDGDDLTEDSPFAPPPIVGWRPAVVERVRAAAKDGVHTVVVAPANVYGGGGGIPALLAHSRQADGLLCPGGDQHVSNVYRDDIAALYALALTEAAPGAYLLGASVEAPTMHEVVAAASRGQGLDGRVVEEPADAARDRLGPLADALLLDSRFDCGRARALGWRPSGPSLVDELATGSYATVGAGR